MDLNEFNARCDVLAKESYRVIRHKVNNFENTSNNDEIAGYVKGVVALQTELYEDYEREYRFGENKRTESK